MKLSVGLRLTWGIKGFNSNRRKASIDNFEDLVKNGLVADIFKADRAFHTMKEVGESSSKINRDDTRNFGELFGTIQDAMQTEALLAVSRLFDRPSAAYPTRCIRGLLNYLIENKENLPEIIEKPNLKKLLISLDISQEIIMLVDVDSEKFIIELSEYYLNKIESEEVQRVLNKLKLLRDKVLAHNEVTHDVKGPTWLEFSELLSIAKDLVGILGWAYMSTSYMYEGVYELDSDALNVLPEL